MSQTAIGDPVCPRGFPGARSPQGIMKLARGDRCNVSPLSLSKDVCVCVCQNSAQVTSKEQP